MEDLVRATVSKAGGLAKWIIPLAVVAVGLVASLAVWKLFPAEGCPTWTCGSQLHNQGNVLQFERWVYTPLTTLVAIVVALLAVQHFLAAMCDKRLGSNNKLSILRLLRIGNRLLWLVRGLVWLIGLGIAAGVVSQVVFVLV